MDQLLPLATVIPLLVAAGISALNPVLRGKRRVLDGIAILAAAAVAGLLAVILIQVIHRDQVYWFAGFIRTMASRSASTMPSARSTRAWPAWPRCWSPSR